MKRLFRPSLIAGFCLAILLPGAFAFALQEEPAPAKAPVPDKQTREKLFSVLKDVFKSDYSKSDAKSRTALVKTLLSEAAKTSDANQVFVMLVEARNLAAGIGDIRTAFDAVRRIETGFDLEAAGSEWSVFSQKMAALDTARRAARTQEAREALARAYLSLAGEEMGKYRFETALEAAKGAERSASTARNRDLSKEAKNLAKEIGVLVQEQKSAQDAEMTLTIHPDDPKANLALGVYRCFVRNDWETGIPCLAKGKNPDLRELAKKELGKPATVKEQADLGDAWLALSQKALDDLQKERYRLRARAWYERALKQADGFLKMALEKKITDVPAPKKGSIGVGSTVNLIGRWTLQIDAPSHLFKVYLFEGGTGTLKCMRHESNRKRYVDAKSNLQWKVENGKLHLIPTTKRPPFSVYFVSLPLRAEGNPVTTANNLSGDFTRHPSNKD